MNMMRKMHGRPHFLCWSKVQRRFASTQSLASWLHGTAFRICLKASARLQRRKLVQLKDLAMIPDESLYDLTDRHTESVLHEELNRLPEQISGLR